MRSTESSSVSRRQFLRGDFSRKTERVRPPWALPETGFISACSKCDRCKDSCPENIIVIGDDGYPFINFEHSGCSFCGDCLEACEDGALSRTGTEAGPWALKAEISSGCIALQGVDCRSCGDSCDAEAIAFRHQLGAVSIPHLDQSLCTGCGFCISTCPVEAIEVSTNTNEAFDYGNN